MLRELKIRTLSANLQLKSRNLDSFGYGNVSVIDALGGLISGVVCAVLSVRNIEFVRRFKVSYQSPREKKDAEYLVIEMEEDCPEQLNMAESTENAQE